MSEWREDNFGSQGARDFLAMQIARLIATVNDIIKDPERCSADEDGETMLMPCVEVLAMLCERYDAIPPKPATVDQWHSAYLDVFDRTIDELEPPEEYKAARRKVIENTFRWLESLSANHWGNG